MCAGAMLATCSATPTNAEGAGAAMHAFIGADGSVLVDGDAVASSGAATGGAGALAVLGSLEGGRVVDPAGAEVAVVSDVAAVRAADLPADTLRKLADRGVQAGLLHLHMRPQLHAWRDRV